MSVHLLGSFQDVPRRPGRRSRDLAGTEHGFESLFLSETEMDPGSTIPLHTHPVEEAWVITQGQIWVCTGDDEVLVSAGSVICVPPGVAHALRNDGLVVVRALTAAPWSRATFYSHATTYLEGEAPLA